MDEMRKCSEDRQPLTWAKNCIFFSSANIYSTQSPPTATTDKTMKHTRCPASWKGKRLQKEWLRIPAASSRMFGSAQECVIRNDASVSIAH